MEPSAGVPNEIIEDGTLEALWGAEPFDREETRPLPGQIAPEHAPLCEHRRPRRFVIPEPTTRTLLVLDDRVVAGTERLRLRPGPVAKSPRNPLFGEAFFADPPKRWEARYDNLYPTVIFDDGRYQLWYNVSIRDESSEQTPLAERVHTPFRGGISEKGLLYAVSDDGLAWTKPDLGLIAFAGSLDNNIVMSTESHGVHGAGVLKDPLDRDPARRYKALFKAFFNDARPDRMATAFSADGLRWSQPLPWPEHSAAGDTHNNALRLADDGRYVALTRGWVGAADDRVRVVLRTESEDFVHWSEPLQVFRGEDAHDQIYSMPMVHRGSVYLGLPAIFHKGDETAPDWDTVDTELAWSPDTVSWNRVCPGEPLIPRGEGSYPDGAYDCCCLYAAAPLLMGDSHYLYYYGGNGQHNAFREGTFNLATLPRDRFAGYQAARSDGGRLTTSPLTLGAGGLTVNVDVARGGSLRAAVLDETGRPIEGYGLDDCAPIFAGGLDAALTWKKRSANLGGRRVRLVFELHQATLYALSGTVRLA